MGCQISAARSESVEGEETSPDESWLSDYGSVEILSQGVDGKVVLCGRSLRGGKWCSVKCWAKRSLVRDPRQLESLKRETAVLRESALGSDASVAAFLGLCADDLGFYLVTEFCPGGDLNTRRRRLGGRLPTRDVAWYARDALGALAATRATRGCFSRLDFNFRGSDHRPEWASTFRGLEGREMITPVPTRTGLWLDPPFGEYS